MNRSVLKGNRAVAYGADGGHCYWNMASSVFPLRKFYSERMFVLLRTERTQLVHHADTQTVKRYQR